ncbi:LysM peptidoglycan-binding domain-containing protein [Streptomyces sp. NBC_00876]|uniref:transglycosylase family protein n=1 Tax=Streptomyces sp. NBC_00876 TaxID=2975853 RepID=UPI00386B7BF5|nr:LysM peptidoglycan-binding domain-containing protein [Streptomyces sp. NBC_00876]
MGSANGRHRRPRQAPAIIVAAGVTGSAIAIPLLGAAGAHAAEASTWDRVAECESGGMWSADLGNGFYGGLQFSQETWKAYGGESYAERADLASRSQQIAVAEKVLDDQGPKAWPSCAVISGLAVDGSLPGVDPGGTPSADPSGSADASLGADPADDASSGAAKTPKGDAKDDAKGEGAGEDAAPDASASPSSEPSSTPSAGSSGQAREKGKAAGKHRGAPASGEAREDGGDTGRDSGRHASRGDSGARDTGAKAADGAYTVRPGDNLWAIADAQKLPGGWTELYEANKAEVGSDPDLILPGQSLDLGVKAG